jgi:hypothetical protein
VKARTISGCFASAQVPERQPDAADGQDADRGPEEIADPDTGGERRTQWILGIAIRANRGPCHGYPATAEDWIGVRRDVNSDGEMYRRLS